MGRRPKLTPEEVEKIRWLYKSTACSLNRIARVMGVSSTLIGRVIDRKPPYDKEEKD